MIPATLRSNASGNLRTRQNPPRAAKAKAIRRIAVISKGRKKFFLDILVATHTRRGARSNGRGGRRPSKATTAKKWTKPQIRSLGIHHSLRCTKHTKSGRGAVAIQLGKVLIEQDKKIRKALKIRAKSIRDRAQKRRRRA